MVIAYSDHEDQQLESEVVAGEAHGTTPLSGTGLGGDAAHTLLLVVVCLRDGSVGLV